MKFLSVFFLFLTDWLVFFIIWHLSKMNLVLFLESLMWMTCVCVCNSQIVHDNDDARCAKSEICNLWMYLWSTIFVLYTKWNVFFFLLGFIENFFFRVFYYLFYFQSTELFSPSLSLFLSIWYLKSKKKKITVFPYVIHFIFPSKFYWFIHSTRIFISFFFHSFSYQRKNCQQNIHRFSLEMKYISPQ